MRKLLQDERCKTTEDKLNSPSKDVFNLGFIYNKNNFHL